MRLDTLGQRGPQPIAALDRAVAPLDPGDVILMDVDDPAFPDRVRSWCRQTGHCVLCAEEHHGRLTVLIRKAS